MKKRVIKKQKEIYLDFASATPVSVSVRKEMEKSAKYFANPSAIHKYGVLASRIVEDARAKIASLLLARKNEVIFTSGATESNSLAILGAIKLFRDLFPNKVPEIIISAIEHASVEETARALGRSGIKVKEIPVHPNGIIDLKKLKESINENTALVSVMYANNEIGTIQPIREIAKIINDFKKSFQPPISNLQFPLLHSDACQAIQYEPVSFLHSHTDLMTFNASKIYGPRGIGVLLVRSGIKITPMLYGGEQENGLRPGTEPTELIVGLATALSDAILMREREAKRLSSIRDVAFQYIKKKLPTAKINGDEKIRLPNNISFSIPNIDSEYLLLELSEHGIYASSRSACGLESGDTSHVIMAVGGEPKDGNLRLSLGRTTTKVDVLKAIDVVVEAVKKAQRFAKVNDH